MHPKPTPIIGVHLDLKGVAFRPGYLPHLLADLAGQGINAVLVEYEDLFPFAGINVVEDRRTLWTEAGLRRFLLLARRHGIEVIPLQQCLGHLEYVFRWDCYRGFAEDRAYPSTLCLSNPRGKALIRDMLAQILSAHPDSRYVHLGMDEAHALATCPQCRKQGDVLDVFVRYLHELCDQVEAAGKTPLIWSDMLEDHFRPEALKGLRERVILCPWDYSANGEPTAIGRFGGFRTSKSWLAEPENPAAPALGPGSAFVEDYPPALRRIARRYMTGRMFKPLFQVDLWTELGFRVIGPSFLRSSADGPVLSRYNICHANLRAWSNAIRRNGQLGQIATSWERGTSWCPPNFNIDLTWPSIAVLAKSMGARPATFLPGIPAATVKRLVGQLGRCRLDWRLELALAEEMERLAPQLTAHRHEWESLALMARVLHLQRRAEFAHLEMTYFHANNRPVDSEWRRRLDAQSAVLRDLRELRRRVRRHFGRRYFGKAFEEWVSELFDLHEAQLMADRVTSRRKLRISRRRYCR
jgi:hypothetical protein